MKKLQNNFTTPEQSKLLLELGIPAESANCCYPETHLGERVKTADYVHVLGDGERILGDKAIPCWSVGRLIEIMTICYKWDLLSCASFRIYVTDIIGHNLINQLINDLSLAISRDKIDFSKLEE